MPKQTFHKGDKVKLADKFPSWMDHFPGAGQIATVVGSYTDQFAWGGTSGRKEYTLKIPGHGRTSWYPESLMTFVSHPEVCPTCGQKCLEKSLR